MDAFNEALFEPKKRIFCLFVMAILTGVMHLSFDLYFSGDL